MVAGRVGRSRARPAARCEALPFQDRAPKGQPRIPRSSPRGWKVTVEAGSFALGTSRQSPSHRCARTVEVGSSLTRCIQAPLWPVPLPTPPPAHHEQPELRSHFEQIARYRGALQNAHRRPRHIRIRPSARSVAGTGDAARPVRISRPNSPGFTIRRSANGGRVEAVGRVQKLDLGGASSMKPSPGRPRFSAFIRAFRIRGSNSSRQRSSSGPSRMEVTSAKATPDLARRAVPRFRARRRTALASSPARGA